jgi:FHA domain
VNLGSTKLALDNEDENSDKRHFVIKYRPDLKGYFLKDTGEGTGTFVKIDRHYVSSFIGDNCFL